jgi:hypothetical protein
MIKKYEDQRYGCLVVDFEKGEAIEDSLDRKRIWEDAHEDYVQQQIIYSCILDDLLGDDCVELAPPRPGKNENWAGKATDFGFVAILADGSTLKVDAEGAYFWKR